MIVLFSCFFSHRFHVYLVVFFLLFFTFYCILSVFMDCWSDTNKMMMMIKPILKTVLPLERPKEN